MGYTNFLFCFVWFFGIVYGADYVPVLIWGSNKPAETKIDSSALKQYSTDQFESFFVKLLSGYQEKPLVVIFTEENLSVEDFSWQDNLFPQLQELSKDSAIFQYLPAVNNPLKALRRLQKLGYSWHSGTSDLIKKSSSGVVLVHKLEDAQNGEDRSDFLNRHDSVISEVYKRLTNQGHNVVALYTGHYSSWVDPENEPVIHRVRRLLADPGNITSHVLFIKDEIMLYASSMPILNVSGEIITLTPFSASVDRRPTFQSLTAKFKPNNSTKPSVTLMFFFYNSTSSTGYWSLDKINVTQDNSQPTQVQTLTPDANIVVPMQFSYHCSSRTVFKANDTAIVFQNFQVQPFMHNESRFADAYNCEMFFTAPIWSGLFITSILGLIMIWGLVMIMDIRTNDQFDDPKGKTITITATD